MAAGAGMTVEDETKDVALARNGKSV